MNMLIIKRYVAIFGYVVTRLVQDRMFVNTVLLC